MRTAVVRVSHTLLARLLMLPDGCEVVACWPDFATNSLLVKCASDAFPATAEGEALPVVVPVYHQVQTAAGRIDYFGGWHGLPGHPGGPG